MHLMPWHKHFEGIKQNLMSKLDREEENEGEFNGLWGEGEPNEKNIRYEV